MVFGIIPEYRSASLRKERSASRESPLWCRFGILVLAENIETKSTPDFDVHSD
jgi:hypothetical protein